jgi:hypothetical protein
MGRPPGVDPSPMESFIGVNVSHPRQESLVQQKRLDGPMSRPGPLHKFFCRNLERVRAQVGQGSELAPHPLPFQAEPAELTLVHETKMKGIIPERKDHMGMFFLWHLGGDEPQSSSHAQMNSQGHIAAEVKDDVFSLSLCAEDFPSSQGDHERFF